MHPKGTFCPAVGRPGEHPPGRKVLRSGCASLHPAAKVESVLKVEPKSKRSQSRRGIPYLKVEWFCAKKSPAKSNWVWVMHFCFMIQVYTPCFWPFCMDICFNRWFLDWTIIRVDGSFLMMTASCSRYSLLSFPLLGFIPLYFPAFLGVVAALNRHFRAGFRLYYGI